MAQTILVLEKTIYEAKRKYVTGSGDPLVDLAKLIETATAECNRCPAASQAVK